MADRLLMLQTRCGKDSLLVSQLKWPPVGTLVNLLFLVAGDGIVAVPRKFTAGLPPSLPAPNDPDSDVYGISMFHQLHCLVSSSPQYNPLTDRRHKITDFIP